MSFIELNRTFVSIPKDHEFGNDDFNLAFSYKTENIYWSDIVKKERVVILAEAGSGKTEEISDVTCRLRLDGIMAFFLRLEHLCDDFDTSFEKGDLSEFQQWLTSGEEAYFFLDSVDEARLQGPSQFEKAIRKLAVQLGNHKQRARIFITSRPSAWRAKTDLELIQTQLPYFSNKKQPQDELSLTEASNELTSNLKELEVHSESTKVESSIYGLQPLDEGQKRIFAESWGVSDSNRFLAAIEKSEADIFSNTPQDLIELMEFWNANGAISNRAEMIHYSIKSKLDEEPERASALPLSSDNAMSGAKRIAAAATFLRKNRILVPDQSHDSDIKHESIDIKRVLNDWDDKECQALLLRPVFDVAVYGTVRFHHRSTREYLTAQWLFDLLQAGVSRRSIEGLLFAERYGEQVTVPSLRPVLAWLILWDDRIRERTVNTSPEVLIQGGDPSALPTEVREGLLRDFCQHYSGQRTSHLSFDIAELRRFAHPDLGNVINELINKYANHDEIVELLLRMVWQGGISDCSEVAFINANDSKASEYRRTTAIRALSAGGSSEQKRRFVASVIDDAELGNENIIDDVISHFAPQYLDVSSVLTLLARIKNRDRYSVSALYYYLAEYVRFKCPAGSLIEFVGGALTFLKHEPVIEKRFFELSEDYQWLLPVVSVAVERVIKEVPSDALKPESLEVISLSQASRSYDVYHPSDLSLDKLIAESPELNKALFWFDVELARKQRDKKKNERVVEYWQANTLDNFWRFDSNDFESVLDDVRSKKLLDDRLVALSLAFNIYTHNDRGNARRRAMWRAVKGESELESKLSILLNPPPMDKEQRTWRREESGWKRKAREREEKEAENRKGWVKWLREHVDVLRDNSIAEKGSVWDDATSYLLDVLREKTTDSGHWAQSYWQALIQEFGQDVAEAFRDGCIEYWRKYIPEVRSEGMGNPNHTPYAVIVGLSGLGMEIKHNGHWPCYLSESEVELACRYAVRELNGFPDWLQSLHQKFPDIVEHRLLQEVKWEFAEFDGEQPSCYMFSHVTRVDWLRPSFVESIIELLKTYEPSHDKTVEEALGIVLASDDLDVNDLLKMIETKLASTETLSRKAMWYAAWTALKAGQGIAALDERLSQLDESTEATELAMLYITSLVGGRRSSPISSHFKDYQKVENLTTLIKLMHQYISHSEDINRSNGGAYSPTLRDNAQDARDFLFRLLKDIPGKETYLAMLDLAQTHPQESARDWYAVHAKQRAEEDTEQGAWIVDDIASFTRDADKKPQNNRELFDLAVSRLNDLKDNLEGGDLSNAELLAGTHEEVKHRVYIGAWLRENSSGLYTVPQEEEMADAKKPDIRFHQQEIGAPVPVELKVADNWSANKLLERLKNQLCGQYLRDVRSNCGIFLLTYCGNKKWKHPETGKKIEFLELLKLLEAKAEDILHASSKIEAVEVIGIDLAKRNQIVQVGIDI